MTLLVEDAETGIPHGAEQLFAKLYAEHWDHARQFIASRLDWDQAHLAEDMAQETFIILWSSYVQKNRIADVGRPFALIATIGRTVISKHYRSACRNTRTAERAVDFMDPSTGGVVFTRHVYVGESPELALEGRDLDAALATMADASEDWRTKDRLRGRLVRMLRDDRVWQGGLTPEKQAAVEAAAVEAAEAEAAALKVFREACQSVATLRAEIERQAGPNWRSSTGMPPSQWKKPNWNAWTTDPDCTHCPAGHELNRDNVTFTKEATRQCMPCSAACSRKSSPAPKTGRAAGKTLSIEAVAKAVELLFDPDNKRTIRSVAQQVGCTEATLYKRVPDLKERRQQVYGELVSA